ncbi:Non-specific lipid transfer protein GPI-anchored 19 [Linum perenne]
MAAVTYHGATAQSGGCTSALISLTPCLSYPQCLCQLVGGGGGSSLGITINQTRALELPDACSVTTPSVSRCNAGGNPPADSSDNNQGTPAGTPPPGTPSNDDGGSANTSGGSANTSGASFVGMQLHDVRLFLVLVASCALSSFGHY